MKENLELMKQRNISIPVLLGGAALTPSFVKEICAPLLKSPVIYCPDAFTGLSAMNLIKEKNLSVLTPEATPGKKAEKKIRLKNSVVEHEKLRRDIEIPDPPFWGVKIVKEIDLDTVFNFLNEGILFSGRWGYRRGKMSKEEYDQLIEKQVRPELEILKQRCIDDQLLVPQIAYGYFPCNSHDEELILYDPKNRENELTRFHFPRQEKEPYRSIADFFLPADSGKKDLIALQIATVGQHASQKAKEDSGRCCGKVIFRFFRQDSAVYRMGYSVAQSIHIHDLPFLKQSESHMIVFPVFPLYILLSQTWEFQSRGRRTSR